MTSLCISSCQYSWGAPTGPCIIASRYPQGDSSLDAHFAVHDGAGFWHCPSCTF